jgi:iron-sulfur cluster repair protein YtfE (RIC family)
MQNDMGPLDTILAYHEKVRAQLRRLREIETALVERDIDSLDHASRLADEVLRTLGEEMVLHEKDEGESLFPRLAEAVEQRGETDSELADELLDVRSEHQDSRALWRFLSQWLYQIAAPAGIVSLDDFHRACDEVEDHLVEHMEREERVIFPAARQLLSDEELAAIAEELKARRCRRKAS